MSDILVEWTQAETPEFNEIWKDINGGGYALLDTIAGNTSYHDTSATINSGDVWTYEVRGKNGAETGDFSNVGAAARDKSFLVGTAISEPTWILHFGDLYQDTPDLVTSYSMPNLKRVYGALGLDGMTAVLAIDLSSLVQVNYLYLNFTTISTVALPALTTVTVDMACDNCGLATVDWPVLAAVGGNLNLDQSSLLTSVSMASLTTVGGNLAFDSSSLLTTISMASLVSIGGSLHCDSCALTSASFPLLTTVSGANVTFNPNPDLVDLSLPNLVYENGKDYFFNGCALSVASVESILAAALASAVTSATIDLSGGTNAAFEFLSALSQQHYETLDAMGNTMNINFANVVANHDFETGDFTSWTVVDVDAFVDNNPGNVHTDTYGAFLVSGTISQTLTTGAGDFTLSFWLKADDTITTFDVYWEGGLVASLGGAARGWTQYTYSVTATGATSVLSFTHDSFFGMALDDILVLPD